MTTDWNHDAAAHSFERIDGQFRLTVKRLLDMAPHGNRWKWAVLPIAARGYPRAKAGLVRTWEAGMFAAGDAAALLRAEAA